VAQCFLQPTRSLQGPRTPSGRQAPAPPDHSLRPRPITQKYIKNNKPKTINSRGTTVDNTIKSDKVPKLHTKLIYNKINKIKGEKFGEKNAKEAALISLKLPALERITY
jgi:hypothetical protein